MTQRKCPVCGKWFIPNTPHQKFCSTECYQLYYKLSPKSREILNEINSTTVISFEELLSKYGIKAVKTVIDFLKTRKSTFEVIIH